MLSDWLHSSKHQFENVQTKDISGCISTILFYIHYPDKLRDCFGYNLNNDKTDQLHSITFIEINTNKHIVGMQNNEQQ